MPRADWVALAKRCEDNGYSVLTMPDHFDAQLAPVPALMCVADATASLRIGALVFDNDYKHPVVLAKELATLDVLSDGRLEIGLGAGWKATDYEHAGIPYDSAKVRIDRFTEGLAVIKGCLGPGPFSFAGEHYTVTQYDGLPKPLQHPLPPILIGGGGKRVLGIAAREADIVGINGTVIHRDVDTDMIMTMTAEAVDDKVGIVRAAAGPRLDDIELHVRVFILQITDQRDAATKALADSLGVPQSFALASPFVLIGSTDQIVHDLIERRERWGFSFISISASDVQAFAPVVAALAGK